MGILLVIIVFIFLIPIGLVYWDKLENNKKETAYGERFNITNERLLEANKMMKTDFFNKIRDKLIENIKDSWGLRNIYIGPYDISISCEASQIGSFGHIYFREIGYENLSEEQQVILAIALKNTGYFDYVVELHECRHYLKPKNIKTHKQIEQENLLNSLKSIY